MLSFTPIVAADSSAAAATPAPARWSCAACTLSNDPDAHRCAVCLTFRSDAALAAAAAASDDRMAPKLAAATAATASWVCGSCTLLNRKLRTTCRACGASKPAAASASIADAADVSPVLISPPRTSKRRKGLDREVVAIDSDEASGDKAEADAAADDDDEAMAAAAAAAPAPTAARGRKARSSKKRRSGAVATADAPSFATMSAPASSSSLGSFSPASMLASMGLSFGGFPSFGAAPSAAASSSSSAASPKKPSLPALTAEDTRAELTDAECTPFYASFTVAAQMHSKHKAKKNGKKDTSKEDAGDAQALDPILHSLYKDLGYTGAAASSSNAAASSSAATASAASSSSAAPLRSSQCQSCYTEFCDDCQPVQVQNCGHAEFCSDCFSQVVGIKIKDEAVMPWLGCPSAGCRHPLTVRDLHAAASTAQLAHLAFVYMRKRLVRTSCYVGCQTRDCGFGFIVQNTKAGKAPKAKKMTCVLCNVEQMVERGKEGELDDTFKQMIARGELRPCPKCSHLTMKEKGVCNVLQCVKCSVWWNWRTKETGKDSTTLKNRARQTGSLWEAGELEFQRRLEQTNPAEFKKLLERNGGKYDPNYVRGQG